MVASTRLGRDGRITVLAEIRRELELKPGSSILWMTDGRGNLTVHPLRYTLE